jgi:hypothetical protein
MSATSLSVSRLAVPLPMAISSTLCLRISPAISVCAPNVVARLERIDGRRVEQLAGAVHHRDLDAGADARIEPHRGARAGRSGEQQILEVAGENPDRLLLGLFAHLGHQVERQAKRQLHLPRPLRHIH